MFVPLIKLTMIQLYTENNTISSSNHQGDKSTSQGQMDCFLTEQVFSS